MPRYNLPPRRPCVCIESCLGPNEDRPQTFSRYNKMLKNYMKFAVVVNRVSHVLGSFVVQRGYCVFEIRRRRRVLLPSPLTTSLIHVPELCQ